MFKERLAVNLPAERAYSSLLNYLKEHRIEGAEVIRSEPSYIEVKLVEVGWGASARIKITSLEENKSSVLIDFNFNGYIIPMTAISLLFILLIIIAFALRVNPHKFPEFAAELILMGPVATISFLGYAITSTKKEFQDKISGYFSGIERATSSAQDIE